LQNRRSRTQGGAAFAVARQLHVSPLRRDDIMFHRCGHAPCDCDTEGKEFCSTHCAQANAMEEEKTSCECHHAACKHSAQAQPSREA
jgi:hypothetical protein